MLSDSRTPFLVIISAPSGCGKTTLIKSLLARDDSLRLSVSHTTRKPRIGEEHGKDYFFVDRLKFRAMIEAGEFLEWAQVHGNFYGTSLQQVEFNLAQGYDLILDIDVQGRKQIVDGQLLTLDRIVSIFILPPSFAELEARLRKRSTDSDSDIVKRLSAAWDEMSGALDYEYLVFNVEIPKAVSELQSIVMAERLRPFRLTEAYQALLRSRLDGAGNDSAASS